MTKLSRLLAACAGMVVASAHAEPIARDPVTFTDQVARAMRRQAQDVDVVVKGPLTLGLGELQANLDRIYSYCGRDAEGCPAEVDRYVHTVVQVYRDRHAPPTREAVRVVVRTAQYVQAVGANLGGSAPVPLFSRPMVAGLVAVPVLDSPQAVKMLGPAQAKELGLSEQEAFELGLANLRQTLPPLMDEAQPAPPGQIGQLVGDSFYPSRLLLPDTWAPLAKAQGGTLIVALPATDAVFYIGEDSANAIWSLRMLVTRVMAQAPNRLSDQLLRWTEAGWQPIPP